MKVRKYFVCFTAIKGGIVHMDNAHFQIDGSKITDDILLEIQEMIRSDDEYERVVISNFVEYK